ncbi:MAG: enolase [Candidatus Amesbacteria bacterium]|nr:enolase [Candidatus Amesbacteria bacterium]
MAKINKIYAREILDSRATPTLEVICILDDGSVGVSSPPSNGAHELRDGDPNRYLGFGVLKAVENINQANSSDIVGVEFSSLADLDQKLSGLSQKLGSNSALGISIAFAKAMAVSAKMPLYKYIAKLSANQQAMYIPTPLFNMINGGSHGAGNLDFQEFWVVPNHLGSFAKALETGAVIYLNLKKLLARRGAIHSVGDEGGFAPNLFTNLDALEILNESIIQSNRKPNIDVELGLDLAPHSFYKDGRYMIKDRSSPMETGEFIDYLRDLNSQYHLRLLEDPLSEDDWKGWAQITAELGNSTTIVGDDLLMTNPDRVKKAIVEKSCNALLVKLNELNTVTDNLQVIKLARDAGWKIIVSHRSGETNDTFIADLAVGVGADYVKFGAPARGERVAKYNRLLAIETEILVHP